MILVGLLVVAILIASIVTPVYMGWKYARMGMRSLTFRGRLYRWAANRTQAYYRSER